jgi:hypothetical protein
MESYFHITLPAAAWIAYIEKAREHYLRHDFTGAQDKVENILVGAPFYNLWTNIPFVTSCFIDP